MGDKHLHARDPENGLSLSIGLGEKALENGGGPRLPLPVRGRVPIENAPGGGFLAVPDRADDAALVQRDEPGEAIAHLHGDSPSRVAGVTQRLDAGPIGGKRRAGDHSKRPLASVWRSGYSMGERRCGGLPVTYGLVGSSPTFLHLSAAC